MVINAWCWHFVELLSRLIRQLTISFHTFLGKTFHKTMKKYEDFEGMAVSLLSPRKFAIRTWFCNCPQYLCLFGIVFEYTPGIHDSGKMLVLPNQLLCWVISTSDQDFISFQPILCLPHTQMRITLFHGVRKSHSHLETFSQPYFNRIFSNCLSHNSPAKGWPYRFLSRGTRLDLPYWTMILAICVSVDVFKYLDTPILEFSTICEHLPFLLGSKLILRLLLVHRNLAI